MKKSLLSLLLLPATLCVADVAIYDGAQVVKTTSLPETGTQVEKFIEVIDLAKVVDPTKPIDMTNANLVTISLDGKKGSKTFFVGAPSAVVITQACTCRIPTAETRPQQFWPRHSQPLTPQRVS